MEVNISSINGVPSFPFAYRTLGVMTVARLCKSILLPVSSSTWENEETHSRKAKTTSIVSRLHLGNKQHVKCSDFRLESSSDISIVRYARRRGDVDKRATDAGV
jgi:hypothetical protein